MLEGYHGKLQDNICIDWHDIPWEEKKPLAYWHGAWTGEAFEVGDWGPESSAKRLIKLINKTQGEQYFVPDGSGHPRGRYKLMFTAHDHPNKFAFSWASI